MRTITPILVTDALLTATGIEVSIDNVRESDPACTVRWTLYGPDGEYVNSGSMEAAGDDYTNVVSDNNSAYAFVAANFQPAALVFEV